MKARIVPTVVVLPTCVGMVLVERIGAGGMGGSPHVRGDGPQWQEFVPHGCGFSPRAWGWSAVLPPVRTRGGVLPTCVGMVPVHRLGRLAYCRSPHVRGDRPRG